MNSKGKTEEGYLRYGCLNHWRGLAALMVVGHHLFWTLSWVQAPTPCVEMLRKIFSVGWAGVHLFFVISGYCIAANIHRCASHGQSPWTFLKDRFLRVYPAYWAAVFISILVGILCRPFTRADEVNLIPGLFSFLTNLALVEPYFGTHPAMIVSWTLVYEFGFYVLVAVGYACTRKDGNHRSWVWAGVALAFVSFFPLPQPMFYVLNYWPEFLFGGLVYVARLERWRGEFTQQRVYVVMIPILVIAGFLLSKRLENNWHLVYAASYALLLYFLAPLDSRILHLRWLKWLGAVGAYSYSLYLIHVTILIRASNVVRRVLAPENSLMPFGIIGMGLSAVGGGYLFYRFLEAPLERWRRALRHPNTARAAEVT